MFKELKKVWKSLGEGRFPESNTLLIDDEPYKALLNPPYTAIFPTTYDASDLTDNVLDPKKELGKYLEGKAIAKDVPNVKSKPFGQAAIGPTHTNWEFCSMVIPRSKN